MAWIGAAIGAGAGLLGSMSSSSSSAGAAAGANAKSAEIAYATNAFNAGEAQKTRDWLTQQANTTYQRTTADLQAAGLNPMLGFKTPDPTPGGPSASGVQSPVIPVNKNQLGSAMQGAIAGATEGARTQQNIADAQKAKADATRSLSSAGQLDAQRDNIRLQMEKFDTELENLKARTKLSLAQMLDAKYSAGLKSYELDNAPSYYASRAAELKARADITGLQVPRNIAEAAFWDSSFGKAQPYIDAGVTDAAKAAGAIYGVGRAFRPNTNFNTKVFNYPGDDK